MSALSYAVLGTGALGGLYGGLLANSGADVHFLVHSDFEHIRKLGLRVDSPLGNFHLARPHVYADFKQIPKVDVVLVCWKTTHNAGLKLALEHLCHATSLVLVLQNGWDIESEAAQVVGADRVLGGCCFLCSNKVGPGHIHHLDYGRIGFGEYDQRLAGQITPRMEQLTNDFRKAKIDMQPTECLRTMRWKKLTWNIPFNGLSVVMQADTSQIMHDAQASLLTEELMHEVRQSAIACGFPFETAHIEKMLVDTRKMVPYDSSMLLDYRHQRPMEVEAIFGNPLRAAIQAGYHPARIEMLYRQLSFLNVRNSSTSQ